MYEILLSRIFSVTMGYHYAFLAVSIAMFGLTAGGVYVYLYRQRFSDENKDLRLAEYSLYFASALPISFLIHLYIPFRPEISISGFLIILFTFLLISLPFFFAGVVICVLLTGFITQVNKIYASDLAGSAIGCLLLVYALEFTGAINSVFIITGLVFIAIVLFSLRAKNNKLKTAGIVGAILLFAFSLFHMHLYNSGDSIVNLKWVRGAAESEPMYEKWNSYSRVTVTGDSTQPVVPFGWGLSNIYDRNKKTREIMLNVDANSTTVFSSFDGDTSKLEYLKYDVSNISHYLRPGADVLVIGTGGGRDILTSLVFGQRSVKAIEMNHDMIYALNNVFGNFTGHLDSYPNVTFVQDEARSNMQRADDERYDLLQISVIDNLAAMSSGAFVLTESSIYTIEAWKLFLNRLKPGGILTVTRFWMKNSAEIYRLASISANALREIGTEDPSQNMFIIRAKPSDKIREAYFNGVANLIISRDKFSDADIRKADSVVNALQFEMVSSPVSSKDEVFKKITSGKDASEFINDFPVNIQPPTDDKPFFFHLLRIKDIFNVPFWQEWDLAFNAKAIFILLSLFVITVLLSVGFVLFPLWLRRKQVSRAIARYILYFASIGLGFMLIEIALMQRLNIYLGHPTYSLTVALFTLLLSAGIGSYSSALFVRREKVKTMLILLLIFLFLSARFTLPLVNMLNDISTIMRILVSVLIIFPSGFFMGMAFPVGLMLASNDQHNSSPWLWGINGAFSVVASVLAVILSMSIGITWTYWIGAVFYIVAVFSVWRKL
jgi:hypothetical protein